MDDIARLNFYRKKNNRLYRDIYIILMILILVAFRMSLLKFRRAIRHGDAMIMSDVDPNMHEARKLKLFPWIVTSRFAAARKVADIFAFDFFPFLPTRDSHISGLLSQLLPGCATDRRIKDATRSICKIGGAQEHEREQRDQNENRTSTQSERSTKWGY